MVLMRVGRFMVAVALLSVLARWLHMLVAPVLRPTMPSLGAAAAGVACGVDVDVVVVAVVVCGLQHERLG